jgi:hypothetical protein
LNRTVPPPARSRTSIFAASGRSPPVTTRRTDGGRSSVPARISSAISFRNAGVDDRDALARTACEEVRGGLPPRVGIDDDRRPAPEDGKQIVEGGIEQGREEVEDPVAPCDPHPDGGGARAVGDRPVPDHDPLRLPVGPR